MYILCPVGPLKHYRMAAESPSMVCPAMACASAQPQARRERHPHYLLKFCLAPQLGTPLRTRLTFACPIQVWRVHVFMYCSPNSRSEPKIVTKQGGRPFKRHGGDTLLNHGRSVICDTYNRANPPTHPSPRPYILVDRSASYMAGVRRNSVLMTWRIHCRTFIPGRP